MKRIPMLCLLLAVALAIPTLSQAIEDRGEDSVDSGSILVSGWSSFDMLGVNVENYDDVTTTRAGFNLGVLGGYFVIDSLAVGARFDFGVTGTTVDVNGTDTDFTTLTFNEPGIDAGGTGLYLVEIYWYDDSLYGRYPAAAKCVHYVRVSPIGGLRLYTL